MPVPDLSDPSVRTAVDRAVYCAIPEGTPYVVEDVDAEDVRAGDIPLTDSVHSSWPAARVSIPVALVSPADVRRNAERTRSFHAVRYTPRGPEEYGVWYITRGWRFLVARPRPGEERSWPVRPSYNFTAEESARWDAFTLMWPAYVAARLCAMTPYRAAKPPRAA